MTATEPRTNSSPGPALNWRRPDPPAVGMPRPLTQVVQEAVRAVHDGLLPAVPRREASLAFQPRTLLTLLVCCYARNICSSADIEDALRRDRQFRDCQNEFPGAREIRRFRRDNREALHLCLKAALRVLAEQTLEPGAVDRGDDDSFAEESSRRITKGMFIDSMKLND